MNLNKKMIMLAAGVSCPVLSVSMAHAQEAPVQTAQNDVAGTGEIIVTARKRAESVQDVPLTVTAVSGEEFQARGLTEFSDLTAVTTGLTFRKTSVGFVDFRIRGLGTGGGNDSFEQSVALFVDGIHFSRSPEFSQPMFDMERVEVIKGTQASFLAKNTSLGAINISTRKPGNDWGFDATARYEFNLNSHLVSGGVDVPVTDNLAVRFAGQLSTDGGFIKNLASGADLGERRVRAGRVVAVWEPTNSFDATLMYEEYNNRQIGVPVEVVVDTNGNALARAVATGYASDYELNLNYETIVSDADFGESQDTTKGRFGALTLNKELGDYTLTSVTSYAEYSKYFLFDNDYYIGTFGNANPYTSSEEQYTQELRISSPDNDAFNFIAGVYGAWEKWMFQRQGAWRQNEGIPAGAPGSVSLTGSKEQNFEQTTKTLSGFALVNVEPVQDLTLTAGGRVTHEDREGYYNVFTIVPGSYGFLYNDIPPSTLSFKETLVDFSFGAQYAVNPDLMIYGSFSRGNKGGGYANTPTNLTDAKYGSEHADTAEVGLKYGGGRTYFNVAGFHTKISDFQQSIFSGASFIFAQSDVKSKGFEVDGSYELVPGLITSGALTYAHTRNADGTVPVNSPEWQGNARVSYTADVSDDMEFDIAAGLEYTSKVIFGRPDQTVGIGNSAADTVFLPGPANTLFNARIGLTGGNGDWSVALIGRNITDKTVPVFTNPLPLATGGGIGVATPNTPRTIALQFTIRR